MFSFVLECPGAVPYLDTASITIDFGDGSPLQTASSIVYPAYTYFSNFPYAYPYIYHNYPSTTGSYTVTVIAHFPGNIVDTVIYADAAWLTSNCNTLSGKIYRDNNNNCTFDAGDIPSIYTPFKLWSSSTVSYTNFYTDANGDFAATVINGVNYTITPQIFNYGIETNAPITCLASDTLSFTAGASNVIDFPLSTTDQFIGTNITDSLDAVCYNSSNGNVYLRGSFVLYADLPSQALVNAHIFFGDGNDTVITAYTSYTPGQLFHTGSFGINHQYPGPGNYSLQLILTESLSGVTDTIYMVNEVELVDSCGSLSGYLYNDTDNSCTYTSGEGIPVFGSVIAYQNNVVYAIDYVDINGYYSLDLPQGNYTIDVNTNLTLYNFNMACSQQASVPLNVQPNTSSTIDFGFVCNASLFDASVYLGNSFFRPATTSTLSASVFSQNCNPGAGTVTLILDPLVSYLGSCDSTFTPTVNGNTLTWNYTTTQTFTMWQFWSCMYLYTDSTAQIGDSLCFTIYITPTTPDNNAQNDTLYMCYPVRNSYDPNMKEVRVPGMLANGDVLNNRTHDYTVFFQNTGNDVAYNIFILDTLDSDLNPATLQILGSSHPMQIDYLNGDVLKFNFDNINLPDSNSNEPLSHGWVRYTIAQDLNLAPGTVIANTAHIYFDINPAIITNTTINTIINPTGIAAQPTINANIFPVPANEFIRVRLTEPALGVITLYNMLGQTITCLPLNGTQATIDVRALPPGVYQLQLNTKKGLITQSVIVTH